MIDLPGRSPVAAGALELAGRDVGSGARAAGIAGTYGGA